MWAGPSGAFTPAVTFVPLCFLQRFIQYLASRNTLFNLSNFLDKGGLQGTSSSSRGGRQKGRGSLMPRLLCFRSGYDMSTFIRRYARYLNQKAVSYRQVAFDFTKVRRG